MPVSAWPPGPPGASLSPFGKPRSISVGSCPNGFVIPTGAWIVACSSNRVIMFYPPVSTANPARPPGTGLLPGAKPPPCPATVYRPTFAKHDAALEAYRAWQRTTGNTDPPLRQFAGRRPPNWFGWNFINAPSSILVQPCQSGLVIADGQNVIISGSGFATITQAYSV